MIGQSVLLYIQGKMPGEEIPAGTITAVYLALISGKVHAEEEMPVNMLMVFLNVGFTLPSIGPGGSTLFFTVFAPSLDPFPPYSNGICIPFFPLFSACFPCS